jgi:hypothetical protein
MTSKVKIRLAGSAVFDPPRHRSALAVPPMLAHRSNRAAPSRKEPVMLNAQELANRYVAVWNEADGESRRRQIAALWAPDGQHYVDVREARGHDALEQRILGSYNKNVRDGGHRFYAVQDARELRDVVTFGWEMRPAREYDAVAQGFAILLLTAEGRIRTDYLFMGGPR